MNLEQTFAFEQWLYSDESRAMWSCISAEYKAAAQVWSALQSQLSKAALDALSVEQQLREARDEVAQLKQVSKEVADYSLRMSSENETLRERVDTMKSWQESVLAEVEPEPARYHDNMGEAWESCSKEWLEWQAQRALHLAAKLVNFSNLKSCADLVCAYDWSENDDDAVRAIDELRSALAQCSPAPTAAEQPPADELAELDRKIDAAVHENFGYCPNEKWFDELIERRDALTAAQNSAEQS